MTRPERQVAWFWPVLLLAALAAIAAFRTWSGWATRPMVASDDRAEGRLAGEPTDLAAAGRRLRRLHAEQATTAARLADLRTEITARRRRTRTLDEMLAGRTLTSCPPFLRDDTTVRALQKIIREASGPAQMDADGAARLATAAAVARERLRARLLTLRDRLGREIADLQARATALRQRQRLQETGIRQMRRQVERRLEAEGALSPTPPSPRPSAAEPAR